MAYRLVVADLDGTARSRRFGVTPGVRRAVAAARASGVRVCVATGRMWRSAAPWVHRLGADAPVILYNGGQLFDFDRGRVLHDRRLPADSARQALAVIRRHPEVQPHLFLNDRVYVERRHPLTDAYAEDDGLEYEVVTAFEPLLTEDPHKVLVTGEPEKLEILGSAAKGTGLSARVVRSEATKLEFLPPGVSKATALRVMLEALGVEAEEVIAVGDNWNDLELIEAAGLGVAMGDAPEGVRARADHVCGTADEEGFRQVLERFILG
ncbi:MAG: Cof-type HAD-IIB family hydrolase [Candidatus Rokuibacteriota bacterium]|nr:MAG: Cof-type HAD-IIB family hydrolase [Candidatus Rokubacteria bacterium]